MLYEVSEKIRTPRSQVEIIQALEAQFRQVSSNVQNSGNGLVAKKIARTIGSINRADVTTISLRKTDDGWLVAANVNYAPSTIMYILVVLTIFTAIGWAIPIFFFMMQKEMVRSAVQNCLHNVKNEFDQPAQTFIFPGNFNTSESETGRVFE